MKFDCILMTLFLCTSIGSKQQQRNQKYTHSFQRMRQQVKKITLSSHRNHSVIYSNNHSVCIYFVRRFVCLCMSVVILNIALGSAYSHQCSVFIRIKKMNWNFARSMMRMGKVSSSISKCSGKQSEKKNIKISTDERQWKNVGTRFYFRLKDLNIQRYIRINPI